MLNIIKKTKKSKKWEYGDERYENLSETEKQMLVEYRKKILRNGKNKQRLIEFSWYYQKNNYNLFICLNRQKNLFLEIFDHPSWFFKRIGIFCFWGGGGVGENGMTEIFLGFKNLFGRNLVDWVG